MRQVAAAVSAARDDQCTVLLVEGEAGIGKSRLLSEAAQQYVVPGDIVLHGQAVELSGGDIPYGVVADMLRGLRRLQLGVGRTLDPAVRTSLEDLLTTLTGGETPQLDRGLLLDSFVTWSRRSAMVASSGGLSRTCTGRTRPAATCSSYLIRAVGPAQLLVTMTVRTGEPWPDDLQEFVAETIRFPQVSRLSLRPLSGTELVDQIHQLAAGPVASPVLERVRRLGEGNPFWTEELVLGGSDGTGPVPESVRGLIGTRLLGLGGVPRALSWRRSPSWTTPTMPCSARLRPARARGRLGLCRGGEPPRAPGRRRRPGFPLPPHIAARSSRARPAAGSRRRLHRAWARALDRLQVTVRTAGSGSRRHISGRGRRSREGAHLGYAAAHLAHQASGSHEETRLLRRVLDHWTPGRRTQSLSSGRHARTCGEGHRDSVRRRPVRGLSPGDRAEHERERDRVATIYLRLRRNVVLEELAREQDEPP